MRSIPILGASGDLAPFRTQVREEINALRGRDAENDLHEEAQQARSQQLSLQSLYAKPPPVWLHPAFAAEFGDAFIAGTGLEAGSLHISFEVVTLTLQRMLSDGGSASGLPHAQRAALNTVCSLLDDAKKLAHKLAHALSHQGQQRLYLSRVFKSLESLEPGGLVVIPCAVGESPFLFVIQRNATPLEDLCTLTLVSCDAEKLGHHRAAACPPKMKFETCLSLTRIQIKRLMDEVAPHPNVPESVHAACTCRRTVSISSAAVRALGVQSVPRHSGASWPPPLHAPQRLRMRMRLFVPAQAFWAVLWFAATSDDHGKVSPLRMLYGLLLSFLAENSLEQVRGRHRACMTGMIFLRSLPSCRQDWLLRFA